MRKRLTKQYPGRPLSERIDDWFFSACVLMVGVAIIGIAYNLGAMTVQMVAAR